MQNKSYTKKELDRLVKEMQLLERPLSQWDSNALKGHISHRAKVAAQKRLNRRIEQYDRLRAQKNLVEQGLLNLERIGNRVYASLTFNGHIEALKGRIMSSDNKLPDGRECLVSFDVPEHVRNVRWHIRRLLKNAGFEMVHKSLWKSKSDVVKDFVELIGYLGIQDWIKVYVAEQKT